MQTLIELRELAEHRRSVNTLVEEGIVEAILNGATQAEVADALGVTQPAVSQMLRARRERTIGPYWTIPFLAGRLADKDLPLPTIYRHCAQFVADFRRIHDPAQQRQALGAPGPTGQLRLDCLVAAVADYEAHRAGLPTPEWARSSRYDMFPSWFMTSSRTLMAYLMTVTPPQFMARGIFLDPRNLESV